MADRAACAVVVVAIAACSSTARPNQSGADDAPRVEPKPMDANSPPPDAGPDARAAARTPCGAAARALAEGRWRDLAAVPSGCTVDDVVADLPALGGEEDDDGFLGQNTPRQWRALFTGIAGDELRVWHDEGAVVAIALEKPSIADDEWDALRATLGEPEARLDYYRDVVPQKDAAWLYLVRGLAFYTSLEGGLVERIVVFAAGTTREEFLTRLAMDRKPDRELPPRR